MNIRIQHLLAAWALLSTLNLQPSTASAQGTAFTYQGRLNDTGQPANGLYDIRGGLYATNTGGILKTVLCTNSAVAVSNGLFTITMDFGDVFDGTPYWLQVGVRTNGTGANFTPLSPRQPLTPAPYAIFANTANNVSGANVNAATLDGLVAGNFWQLGGNSIAAGQFIGTTDSQPLDLYANNVRALRLVLRTDSEGLYSNAPNVIGGSSVNSASASYVGETIGGGGGNIGASSLLNSATGDFGTISGGGGNIVTGDFTTVGGGYANIASFPYATVSGGSQNIAGGYYSTVPGGFGNNAEGYASFAAGQYAQTTHDNTFIWGDGSQNPFTGANFANGFNVLASGGVFFFNGNNGVHIDYLNQNSGTIDYGLRFGAGNSGEGIASRRTTGGNQSGLDFYTSSANRMSIANNGFVGIGTTSPDAKLEVNGEFLMVDGNSGLKAYLGDDGSGQDVQVGSLQSGITTVSFFNEADSAFMHIGCSSITIHGGSDLAEPFELSSKDREIPQGSVVVIDDRNPGHLKLSDRAYDTRVAGVISGANGVNPGIQMQQQGVLEGGKNVALSGRVYVLADTANGAIQPGDLLTTSATPGHAMKVTEHAQAQGAILGKAMTPLKQGRGMVLVLVTLQ